MGALGGGLTGLGGYNGLPSVMSGLDESMSDIEARKKYPFELEKAMHNVMFIQHHMQRQDDFNAVSTTMHRDYMECTYWHININGILVFFCLAPLVTGGSGLGIRCNGYGPTVPLAVLAGFHYRYVCYPVRSTLALR